MDRRHNLEQTHYLRIWELMIHLEEEIYWMTTEPNGPDV